MYKYITNKQIITYIQARLVIVIFTNKSMLSLGHQLNQLSKLHHSFIKLLIVWSAVDDL